MDFINGKLEWNNDYNTNSSTFETRKKEYDIITKYLDEIEACELVEKLKLLKRIGSESKAAEVFLVEFSDQNHRCCKAAFNNCRCCSAALKVMPIMNKNSYEKNENEMRAALSASTLVLEGSSIYFPIVYFLSDGNHLCNNTIFYNEEYNIKSREYQGNLINQIPSKKEGVYNSVNPVNSVNHVDRVVNNPVNYVDWIANNPIKSNILISELAKEDLYTYLSKNYENLSYDDWINLINHCMKAISDMHYKLNIIHNDLHLKNLLIIESTSSVLNDTIPLIHDFGNAEFVNEDEIELYNYDKLDINFFLENLLELIEKLDIKDKRILSYIKSLFV